MSQEDDTMSKEHGSMSKEHEPVYSRDEVIEEVTKLYELLVGLHISEEDLFYPPDDGWPGINPETMAWMGKDDAVIDLMRHLPYIYRRPSDEAYEIFDMTSPVDYRGPCDNSGWEHDDYHYTEWNCPRRPHYIFTLASSTCRDGFLILINTRTGAVTLYDPMVGHATSALGQPTIKNKPAEEGEEEGEWRYHSTWTVKEFFQILRDKFRSLELLPEDKFQVRQSEDSEDPVAKIFREFGWPEAIREQEKCLEKIEDYKWAEFEREEMEKEAERLRV